MTRFHRIVSDYWHAVFANGEVISVDPALSITVSPALHRPRSVMILEETSGRVQVALTPALAHRIGLDRMNPMSLTGLRGCLASVGVTLHDPDLVFYLPDTQPRPPASQHSHICRQLAETDRAAFAAFRQNASEQDLDDAYVELEHWAVFGAFDRGRLISAASMYPWDNARIADLGVLTSPGFRGQGHAKAVVQAISRFARDHGHEPQYRCQWDNPASIALAGAAGFAWFGRCEVIASDALDRDPS